MPACENDFPKDLIKFDSIGVGAHAHGIDVCGNVVRTERRRGE
jgi:hypothetical protein